MADMQGWDIDHNANNPVVLDNDVTRGQIGKLTATGTRTADVAGAGDMPAGVFFIDVDISEDGTNSSLMTSRLAVVKVGATAVTDKAIPVKPAALGVAIPATTDLDWCIGWPQHLAGTGEDLQIRVQVVQYGV